MEEVETQKSTNEEIIETNSDSIIIDSTAPIHTNTPATNSTFNPATITEMTNKTVEEISTKVEEIFTKLQRNLEHNTRVFQEKSQGLLSKIDQAEEQLQKVLAQIESNASNLYHNKKKDEGEDKKGAEVMVNESIALSDDITKNNNNNIVNTAAEQDKDVTININETE